METNEELKAKFEEHRQKVDEKKRSTLAHLSEWIIASHEAKKYSKLLQDIEDKSGADIHFTYNVSYWSESYNMDYILNILANFIGIKR